MILKPYAAFGRVLTKNSYADNEVFVAVIGDSITCTTFWSKGEFKNRNLSTGDQFRDFPTGTFLRPSDYVPGVFEHVAIGDAEVFCYDTKINNGEEIELEPFYLSGGSETILSPGTKLFLCSGNIATNNANVDKPTQIHVKSENTLFTAVTDCYGIIFP